MSRNRAPRTEFGHQVLDGLKRLNTLRTKPEAPGSVSPLIDLDRRVRALIPRLEAGRPLPDGWRPATSGSGTSGGSSELTSVENAADNRGFKTPRHDPIHEHGHRAVTRILRAVDELEAAITDLDIVDRKTADEDHEPTHCESCARALERPRDSDTVGTVGGRLDKVMRLCNPCRWFVEDHGELPTVEQLQHHHQTGRWRVRTTAVS